MKLIQSCLFFLLFITINSFFAIDLYGQVSYDKFGFTGRWVKWINDSPDPQGVPDPNSPSSVKEFFSEPFILSLMCDGSIDDDWFNDILEATAAWNNSSNLCSLAVASTSNMVTTPAINRPNYISLAPSIIVDQLFADGALARAFIYRTAALTCENPDWGKGFVIFSGDIVFNSSFQWYTGLNNENAGIGRWYSVYSVALHELGHFMGLNHNNKYYRSGTDIMDKAMPSDARKNLQPDDIQAINRLYGYDGLNASADPLYSSIPCDYFEFAIGIDLIALDKNGYRI